MSAFVHIELSTGDVAKAKDFYRKLFGWKLTDAKMPDGMVYTMIKPESGPGGGMGPKMHGDQPTAWMPYVGVKSVTRSLEKAQSLGAHVILPRMEIGSGALAVIADPTGGAIGFWEQIAAAPAPAAKKKKQKKSAKKSAKKGAAKKSAKKKSSRR